MILSLLFLLLFAFSCSIVQQDLPNEAPAIERCTLTPSRTDSTGAFLLSPGEQIHIEVLATDEDDDPLFYLWRAYQADPAILNSALSLASPEGLIESREQIGRFKSLLMGEGTAQVGGFQDDAASSTAWTCPEEADASDAFLLALTIRDRQCDIVREEQARQKCEEEEGILVKLFRVAVSTTDTTADIFH